MRDKRALAEGREGTGVGGQPLLADLSLFFRAGTYQGRIHFLEGASLSSERQIQHSWSKGGSMASWETMEGEAGERCRAVG